MAALNLNHPFLVLPTLNQTFIWRIVAVESNRRISQHKNLELAVEKATRLNTLASMPAPQYAAFESQLSSEERGSCQMQYVRPGEPGYTDDCYRLGSISDLDTSLTYCVRCWKERAL